MLEFIRRQSREFSDPHCLVAFYKSLVRSILEYSSVVWCPSSSLWSNKIESVQKKITRLVLRFTPWRNVATRPSYHARCLIFGLESLATRRETAQILFMKKIILGEIDSPDLLARVNFHVPAHILRNFRYREICTATPRCNWSRGVRFRSANSHTGTWCWLGTRTRCPD